MKNETLFAAIGQIDEDMIAAAMEDAPRKKKPVWIRYAAVAATLLLVVGACRMIHPWQYIPKIQVPIAVPNVNAPNYTYIGGIARDYKAGQTVSTEVVERVWEWQYKTMNERYSSMTLNGTEYGIRRELTDETLLGEKIGTGTAYGFDVYDNDKRHDLAVDVYTLGGIADDLLVAAHLGEAYYVYGKEAYVPPANFGAFWGDYRLAEHLQLADFSYDISYDTQSCYSLTDATEIMEMLQNCGSAPFVEDKYQWNAGCRSVCFTVTAEAWGVYRRGFTITEDGYISTNIMDYGYRFDIGKEVACNIIDCALQNSTETTAQPYTSTLAGQIIAITDDYILVDDSALCEDERDGIVFRVPTEDIRISRHIAVGQITVGDWVQVSFTGAIDAEHQYTVTGAFDIHKGEWYQGDIMIAE